MYYTVNFPGPYGVHTHSDLKQNSICAYAAHTAAHTRTILQTFASSVSVHKSMGMIVVECWPRKSDRGKTCGGQVSTRKREEGMGENEQERLEVPCAIHQYSRGGQWRSF